MDFQPQDPAFATVYEMVNMFRPISHSLRSDCIGSMRLALMAGIKPARDTTKVRARNATIAHMSRELPTLENKGFPYSVVSMLPPMLE
jgi:hypothetical protein